MQAQVRIYFTNDTVTAAATTIAMILTVVFRHGEKFVIVLGF